MWACVFLCVYLCARVWRSGVNIGCCLSRSVFSVSLFLFPPMLEFNPFAQVNQMHQGKTKHWFLPRTIGHGCFVFETKFLTGFWASLIAGLTGQ